MSESDKQTGLIQAKSNAVTKVGAKSLVARGRAELRAREEAEEWFKKGLEFCQKKLGASMNPHPIGTFARLAFLYLDGQGVIQDNAQAALWWRKAAEQGDMNAQYALGSLYRYGQGVTQDYAQAAQWYLKAAEQGDTNATTALTDMQMRNGSGRVAQV